MGFDCRIYGLALEASFEPAGVTAEEPARGDGTVSLRLESASRLAARWSGAARPGAWRGRLRDGAELSIRWGRDGDLLFDYDAGRAVFLLDPEARRLLCAPVDRDALDWQRVLLSRVLPLVAVARGAEALHAGAVDTEKGTVAVLAPSGGGKSTLIAELVERGHALVSDDLLVLTADGSGTIAAHPGSPHLSLGEEPEALGESLGVLGGKHWLRVGGAAFEARPVAALVLLERGAGTAPRTEELPASPLALAPFMVGLPDEEGRDAARFELYSDLVATAPLLRLRAALADPPAALADELERALSDRAATVAEVGR